MPENGVGWEDKEEPTKLENGKGEFKYYIIRISKIVDPLT